MKKFLTLMLLAAMAFTTLSCEKEAVDNTEHSDESEASSEKDNNADGVKEKDNSEEGTGSDESEKSASVETKNNYVPEDAPEDACGENLTWRYDEGTATLYIEGEGDMWDYIRRDEDETGYYIVSRPWQQYSNSIKKVSFGNGVTGIGDNSFYSYGALNIIEISDNIARVGNMALSDCPYLETITVSPNNQYFVSENNILFDKDKTTIVCYPDGKRDEAYTIPDGVTSIESNAFYGCSSLKDVIIPEGVTTIGTGAFWDCSGIKNITIPESVTTIRSSSFWNCRSLSEIHFGGTKEQWDTFGLAAENINNATVTFGK